MKRMLFAVLAGLLLGGCDYFISPQARVERAQAAIDAGDYRVALVELKNALQKDPKLATARLLLAESALWLGNPAGAERELQLAGSVDPERQADVRIRIDLALGRHQQVLDALADTDLPLAPARRSFYRGTALQALRRPAEAQEQFQAAVAADADGVEAQIGVIESQSALGDHRAALDAIARLTTKYPQSAAAWYSYGVQSAGSGGDMPTAKAALSKANELAPRQLETMKQITLLAQLAEVQLMERDLDGARASSKALDQLAAGTPFAMVIASRVAMAENNYGAAITTLRRVVDAAPGLTQARFLLSVALVAQGSLQQASAELNAVVDQAPSNIEARQLLAQVRMQLDDPDGALQVLVPALESDATNVRVNALADTARSKLGAAQSIAMLEQMLAKDPTNTGLQVQLASAYVQAGLPDKAATLLRKDQGSSADTRRAALLLHSITASEGAAAARAEVDRLLAAHPTDPLLMSLAAAFYAKSGDAEAGRVLLKRGLERGVESTSLLFTLAQIEQGAGNATAAREALQRLLGAQPKHVAARMALAEIALAQGDSAGATRELEIVRGEHPTSIEPALQLARIALAGGDAKRAETLFAEILRMGAERADIRNAIGALYLSAGRYDQALEHFRVGTTVEGNNPLLWLNLGRTQLALGQKDTARASVERALKERPQWLLAEGMLAFMDVQDGKREAAMARVAALEKSHPGDAAVRALQAELYAVTGRFSEAAATYEQAYAARPSASLAAKAYHARLAGRLAEPEKLLKKWIELRPADIASRLLLAEALVRSGARKDAVAQYEIILKAQPRDVPSLNNVAWLYYELGDPRAVEFARQAAALAPQSVPVKDTLGWILLERGDLEEGLQLLKDASAQPQAGVEIQYHYAVALARTGSTAEARQRLEGLLRQDNAFAGRDAAKQLLAQLQAGGAATPGAAAL